MARLEGGKSKSGSERWVDFRSADVVDSLSPLCGRNVRMRGSVSLEDIKYIGINVLLAEYPVCSVTIDTFTPISSRGIYRADCIGSFSWKRVYKNIRKVRNFNVSQIITN